MEFAEIVLRRFCVLCGIVLAVVFGTGRADAGNAALVIGNSAYEHVSELPNPRRDSADIAAALERQGFDVVRLDDLNRNDMYDAMRAFRDLADNADIAMIYYAGHGIEIHGQNYLVPVDAELVDERDAPVEMIHIDVLLRQLSGAKSMKMLVLDACRNNPFVTRMKRSDPSRSIRNGLANIESAEADTLIAYAAAAGEITPDGIEGENSPFTQAFLNALDGPPQDVRRLLGSVRDEMRLSVPGAAPFVYSSIGGREYVINPNSDVPSEPAVEVASVEPQEAIPQDPLSNILADFAFADRRATVDGWDEFLSAHRDQNYHVLYSLGLEKREQLAKSNEQRGLTIVVPEPAAPVRTENPELPADRSQPPDIVTAAIEPQIEFKPEPEPKSPVETEPKAQFEPALTYDEAIRQLQVELKDRGCYSGAIDGIIGRGSLSGVQRISGEINEPISLRRSPDMNEIRDAIKILKRNPQAECPQVAAVARPVRPKATNATNRTKRTSPSNTKPSSGTATSAPTKKKAPSYCPDYGISPGCKNGIPVATD